MIYFESLQYVVLGAMITGGIAMVVAGSRMLQGTIGYVPGGSTGMPTALLVFMFGNILFSLSAGYLIRDIQSDEWNGVLE